ncbi:MAG TPA: FtsX-like permease family protein [Vicinamibacterales bacterium]|nr:FtsX-like permease family protein [Vicinamibacterales bacterium]
MFNGIWRDLVHAGRALAKARGFTLVCAVSLGIGMAPVIAIPYLSRILTIQPPGLKTEGLVEILTTRVGSRAATDSWSYPDYADLRDANTGMALVGWTYGQSEVQKDPVRAMFVSTNYFQTIGVTLFRGPGFSAAAEPAVILGYRYWQNHFASDPDIIGKTLTLDEVPHVVAGIAPGQFDGHVTGNGEVAVFLPLERHPLFLTAGTDRSKEWLLIHGRLKPGVSVAQGSAAVSTVTSSLAKQYPSTNENTSGIAAPYDAYGNLVKSRLAVIQALGLTLTGMVLLVVCLNISGMVQVRSALRERELSIRQAIGATRWQLIQYLLSEAIIMAGLGAILASLVLFNLLPLRSLLTDSPLPPQVQEALRMNLPTIGFCVGLCLLTSLAFGLLPALRFSRPVILSALKDDVGVGGRRVGRVQRVTAALQVAIAVPLIVLSGISLDRVRATATADLGFASDLVYAVPLKLDADTIPNADFRIRHVRDDLAKANGVAGASLADGLPLALRGETVRTALQPDANAAPTFIRAHVTRVDNDYLNTMGIPLLRGRGFAADDRAGAELVTIISKTLAEQLFPNAEAGEAIGRRLIFGNDEKTTQTLTVLGISGDVPTAQMSTPRGQLLLPLAQHPSQELFLIARSMPDELPQKMTATLENAARDFNPENRGFGTAEDGTPAYPKVVTGVWLRKHSVDDFLTQSAVAGIAGSVILTLSALGIYGVVGLMVATRTRELAVRVALGASRRRVLGMVLFDVVKLVLPGVVVGVILTAAFTRVNGDNMGIPLSNVEPLAYVVGAAIAVLVALLASLAPARRAASVQPMVAMRSL